MRKTTAASTQGVYIAMEVWYSKHYQELQEGDIMPDTVYTLIAHDSKYPGITDQVVGVYGNAELAKKAAIEHWVEAAGPVAMPLTFTSYDSSHTGLDFHTATGYFDYEDHSIEYSVNGFTVQRALQRKALRNGSQMSKLSHTARRNEKRSNRGFIFDVMMGFTANALIFAAMVLSMHGYIHS
jgi:hypothetical protein